jgi:hypothetical protein
MDNLEFMQWFKRFYELSVSDKGNILCICENIIFFNHRYFPDLGEYDCVGQRSKGKG